MQQAAQSRGQKLRCNKQPNQEDKNLTLRGVTQLVRSWIYSLDIISLSLTNLKAT
jgi:hypothetical protein